MRWKWVAAALVSLACLGLRADRVGIAGDDIDPVSHISAQDEALYAHSSLAMAHDGGWLTPMFLGRFGLYKPPLLMWTSGAAVRTFGVSRLALRIPVVLAATLAAVVVFLWAWRAGGWAAATIALLLLISNHLWLVLGALGLTDGLLGAAMVVCAWCLYRDPRLEDNRMLWLFAAAAAGGILAKSVAGALPLLVLGVYWLLAPHKGPRLVRVVQAGGLAVALAAPWFIYQLATHSRWFLAEHIGLELFAFGAGTPPQTSQENHVLFYMRRMWLMDPVLVVAAVCALPGIVAGLRRKESGPRLLAAWAAVVVLTSVAWQYRNISYALPLIPALALMAATALNPRWRPALVLILVGAFVVKAAHPDQPWGLDFRGGTKLDVAPVLARYCEQGRRHELVMFGMDDALLGTVLPLARIRYAFLSSDVPPRDYSLDFAGMGIMLDGARFGDLKRAEREYAPRLQEWGLESTQAVGTVVLARSRAEAAAMVRAHPEMDFLAPAAYAGWLSEAAAGTTHDVRDAGAGKVWLLSRLPATNGAGGAACNCRL